MKKVVTKVEKEAPQIDYLYSKNLEWISEIEFIKIEQKFFKELLSDHVMELCSSNNFTKATMLLRGIGHEQLLGEKLIKSIKKNQIN